MDDSGTKATEDRLQRFGDELSPVAAEAGAAPINENLFLDEDLDEELQNLDLED